MKKLKMLFRDRPEYFFLLLACLAAFYLFMALASEVLEGESRALDTAILMLMRNPADAQDPLGPPWAEEAMRDLTALGGTAILSFFTLAAAAFFFILKQRAQAFYLLCAVGTGIIFSNALKAGFDIPRPDLFPHGSFVYTQSFPSGHSLMAAVVYLTLGVLLAENQRHRVLKLYIMGLAVTLTALIGISRVYLAVHWPSDVLAGWLAGSAWALMAWLIRTHIHFKAPSG